MRRPVARLRSAAMRSLLFVVGFLVGAGGALILLAGVLSALVTGFAWLRSAISEARASAEELKRAQRRAARAAGRPAARPGARAALNRP